METFISENANPINKRVGDCTIRAISKVLNQDWDTTYIDICLLGLTMYDMPSANNVWGQYLKDKGYRRGIIPDDANADYTVKKFCEDNPKGRFVLVLSKHVVAAIDGHYIDTWDSGNEVPIFYWYKII